MVDKVAKRIDRPRMVVIGGGTGLPVILRNLKKRDVDITAVVTVADDGGSSGILRNYINVLPPGDIRNVLVALSTLPQLELEIFQYRFKSSDKFLSGHAIGNLIITALSEMEGGFFEAVQVLTQMMRVDGHVYPVCDEELVLHAEFSDGSTLAGEAEITAAKKLIKRVWVEASTNDHTPQAVSAVIDAIMKADQIVLGPGSLYTSILPNLMVSNVGKAVMATPAEVVYICNIMTQKGETDHFTDADHVRVLDRQLGQQFVDTVLVNNQPVPASYIDHQRWGDESQPVRHDYQGLKELGCRVISSDFLELKHHGAFHNGQLVSDELIRLLGQPKFNH
ncbi:YvcK family protein [Fructilactobacillus ixorae]|uniref:Putative gluconeogenesis factor n=1 Tax=Fructilactobacillus ixorae TaxID=1750535 RepID=A0ABY5C721_9LACO|nr:YvcK family protein [Fructilactobacillus ixorae]USS93628.1 YvcK family protein [Fructilactobacillus ixorae]